MDMQQLQYFTVLATTENFTRASMELHLTQSALSKSISSLESELGVQLLLRTKKGTYLSTQGKEFFRFATTVLDEYDRCLQKLHDITSLDSKSVNIVCTLPEIFIRVLEKFHIQFPSCNVRLPASDAMTAGEMLTMGQLDFMVNTTPLQHNLIEWVPLMRDEFFLTVPTFMPYEQWQEVDLWEFQEEPFIMPQSNSESRLQMESFCNQAGFTPNIAYEVTEAEMTRKLVQLGYGIAFVSSLSMWNTQDVFSETPDELRTKFLRIRRPLCYRTIGMGRVKNRPMSYNASRLYDEFQQFLVQTQQHLTHSFPMPQNGEYHSDFD